MFLSVSASNTLLSLVVQVQFKKLSVLVASAVDLACVISLATGSRLDIWQVP